MTFSGIAAVEARIQEIRQQVSGIASPPATGSDATTAGSGPTNGVDFASMLTDAMNTQTAVGTGSALGTGGGNGSSTLGTGGGADGVSSLLGAAGTLTGSASAGALGPTSPSSNALSSLVSGLTGTGGSASPDLTSLISSLTSATGAATAASPNAVTRQFIDTAVSQQGKPYVWGATASATDANPPAFDCSELTKWAAARSGVTIPDGAAHQYVWLKEQGATMTVQQALQTPGALLFSFAGEPQPGLTGEPAHAHVAISLGNGKTIEAKGHAYGVGIFDAATRFDYAGMIPGTN